MKKKITGRPNTLLSAWAEETLKHQKNRWESLYPSKTKKKQKNILSSEEVWAHDKLHTMHSLRNNSSDPLYQLPILLLVLLEACVWEHRQAEQADADRDKNVHSSATNVSLHAFLH